MQPATPSRHPSGHILVAPIVFLLALVVAGAAIAFSRKPVEGLNQTLPSDIRLEQWETLPSGGWITGALQQNNSDYAEGEAVPFQLTIPDGVAAGTYEFQVCREYTPGATSDVRGYLVPDVFNADRAAVPTVAVTASLGVFRAANATLDAAIEDPQPGQGHCDDHEWGTVVTITKGAGAAYVLWGGHLAAPSDTDPGTGTSVGQGNGASSFSGGSLHMRLGTPDKSVGIQTHAIIPEPEPGQLTVVKVEEGLNGPNTWNFALAGGPTARPDQSIADNGSTTFVGLAAGTYTVTETNGDSDVCDPASTSPSFATKYAATNDVGSATPGTTMSAIPVLAGAMTTVYFFNSDCPVAGTSSLVIQKFNDPAGDRSGVQPLGGWLFNVTLAGSPIAGSPFETGSGGTAIFISGLVAGAYTVTEVTQASWVLTGSRVDISNDGSFESDGPGAPPAVVLAANGDVTRVNFYNRGLGALEIRKTTLRNGVNEPAQNSGWSVEATSQLCDFTASGSTAQGGQYGVLTFGSVPACNDYVVAENPASKPGANPAFSPSGPASYANVQVAAGQTTVVGFTNVRFDPSTATPTPTQPPSTATPTLPPSTATPTSTATPPSETPTEPPATATPVSPTATPLSPSPAPTEAVVGEITPGVLATPIAPPTGYGMADRTGSLSAVVVVWGLVAAGSTAAMIGALRRRA